MIFGKCAGGAVYSPIQTDLVVAVRDQGYMFVTGPDVIKDVTGEDVTLDELGGADAQARYGNIHQVVESEAAAFQYVRDYLSFLPANTFDDPPIVNPGLEPEITPHDLRARRDRAGRGQPGLRHARDPAADLRRRRRVRGRRAARAGDHHRVRPRRRPARSVSSPTSRCTCRARSTTRPPTRRPGSSGSATRTTLPLVFVVDTPGFMPGVEQEKGGIIKRGGRFLNAVVEADVPKVTITIRKSYGGAYAVMGSKQLTAGPQLRVADRAHRGDRRRGRGAAAGEAVPGSDRARGAEDQAPTSSRATT